MFLFTNREGRTLITQTGYAMQSSFVIPELNRQVNSLVTSTRVTPSPVIQVQGTLGGKNYINVFGEDPLAIQISGVVVGKDCRTLNSAGSSLGVAVEFFRDFGVVNRAVPLVYTITGQESRQAFLVALSVNQTTAFADMSEFNMQLLARSLQNRRPRLGNSVARRQVTRRPQPRPNRNTGQIGAFGGGDRNVYTLQSSIDQLLRSGDPVDPAVLPVIEAGYIRSNEGFDG